MNYVNGWCIDEKTIDFHAENHDVAFGEMVVYALGVNATCVTFCKSSRYPGQYVLTWLIGEYGGWTEILSIQDILDALSKIKIVFEFKAV